jgi:hypothetical protein
LILNLRTCATAKKKKTKKNTPEEKDIWHVHVDLVIQATAKHFGSFGCHVFVEMLDVCNIRLSLLCMK